MSKPFDIEEFDSVIKKEMQSSDPAAKSIGWKLIVDIFLYLVSSLENIVLYTIIFLILQKLGGGTMFYVLFGIGAAFMLISKVTMVISAIINARSL